MTKKTDSTPLPLRHHKASNQAYVLIDGTRHYLGRFDADETQSRYDVFLAEYLANGRRIKAEGRDILVSELLNAFRVHCDGYYKNAAGKPTAEAKHFHTVIKVIREMYGSTPVSDFGPLRLKAVREKLITDGRCRSYINKLVNKIRAIFKWGLAEEMVPASIHQALQAVPGLKRGRCTIREGKAVKPVPMAYVDAVRPHLSRQVAAIMDMQLLTAARPGELVIMRSIDIDTTGDVWVYTPKDHKNAYRDQDRKIYIGPKGQDIIRPFLNRPVEAFLFSPVEAEAERRKAMSKTRKTPLSCGNGVGSNRKRNPKKRAGERYTPDSYRRAIEYACTKADVPRWHPHQLRHVAATNLRKQFGLDVAAIMLGHSDIETTKRYAELNHEAAKGIAAKVG